MEYGVRKGWWELLASRRLAFRHGYPSAPKCEWCALSRWMDPLSTWIPDLRFPGSIH